MPLQLETVDIGEAIAETESTRVERAADQAGLPFNSNAAQQIAQEGQRADNFLEGLYWFRNEYPDADEVVLARLSYGEESLAYDLADDLDHPRAFNQAYLAVATQQGPYLEHTPPAGGGNKSEVRQTIRAIADMAPSFVTWGVNRAGNIDITGGGMGKSYQTLVREKRIRAASESESGENTAESPSSQADTPEPT